MTDVRTTETLFTVIGSPIGPLTLLSREGRLTNLVMHEQAHATTPPPGSRREDDAFAGVADQLEEYFAGDRTEFDVPLELEGTDFQRRVWTQLRAIPYGETISYGELARRVGRPKGPRAVGQANGRNPIPIIVPCHRVLASNGIGGYGGGLKLKRALLAIEGVTA